MTDILIEQEKLDSGDPELKITIGHYCCDTHLLQTIGSVFIGMIEQTVNKGKAAGKELKDISLDQLTGAIRGSVNMTTALIEEIDHCKAVSLQTEINEGIKKAKAASK